MRKKPRQPHIISAHPDKIINGRERILLAVTLLFSFSVSLGLYIVTLAPTVTFEDSGELIAAAYRLGIPHEPGYPLFTLLGRIFTFLPVGTIAYRLNLMSAFFTALGAMWLSWTIVLMIEDIFPRAVTFPDNLMKYGAAVAAGLWMTTAYETWEQAIITEVYGLNAMFTTLLLYLTVQWKQHNRPDERMRYFLLICYVMGLTFSNHSTSVMFLPILFVFALLVYRGFILNLKNIFRGIPFLLLGLTPYLYLPFASLRNPLMDWGNPENWTNFWRTVMRHQYGFNETHTWGKFVDQFGAYLTLLLTQWQPWVLIFAVLGLADLGMDSISKSPGVRSKQKRPGSSASALPEKNPSRQGDSRPYFYLSLLFLFFAVPVTTYLTNFDVSFPNPRIAAENKALVSVFYIPSYIYLALLMGIGGYVLLRLLHSSKTAKSISTILLIALPIVSGGYSNFNKLNMHQYYFTEDYAHNLFRVVSPNALVFCNWDPYYFPLNYYQFVEGQRPDVIVLDQQLLRRSWYIRWLKNHYPGLVRLALHETEEFLTAVAPFEAHQPYDSNIIQQKYMAMINAFIDRTIEAGRDVYLTYLPSPEMAGKYEKESVLAAFKLKQPGSPLTAVEWDSLRFRHFFDQNVPLDRMVKVFRLYYGQLFWQRGGECEKAGLTGQAISCYSRAARFLEDQPIIVKKIQAALQRLTQE